MDDKQKLIDIMFEVAYRSRDMSNVDVEIHMKWVAEQLDACGFPTKPVGMSWGILYEKD